MGPVDDPVDRFCVGIEQQLRRVEALALERGIAAVDAESVSLPRADPREVAVPVECSPLRHLDPRLLIVVVEQAQLDVLGVLGEQREVGTATVPDGAEWERPSGPDLGHRISAPDSGSSSTWPSLTAWLAVRGQLDGGARARNGPRLPREVTDELEAPAADSQPPGGLVELDRVGVAAW